MIGNTFSGGPARAILRMQKFLAAAAAVLLTTVGSANATTIEFSYTVSEGTPWPSTTNKPTLNGFLGTLGTGAYSITTHNINENLTSGHVSSSSNFFTANPSGTCGTGCVNYTQSVPLTVSFDFSETPTTGSWAGITLTTNLLTQDGTYKAKYSGTPLGCTNSTGSQTDCVTWTGATANMKVKVGSKYVYVYGDVVDATNFANGDVIEALFFNASDWSIKPTIEFEYFACGTPGGLTCTNHSLPGTPLPGAVWLFGTVLTGAAGVGGWRRKKRKGTAIVAA